MCFQSFCDCGALGKFSAGAVHQSIPALESARAFYNYYSVSSSFLESKCFYHIPLSHSLRLINFIDTQLFI